MLETNEQTQKKYLFVYDDDSNKPRVKLITDLVFILVCLFMLFPPQSSL